MFWNCPDAEKVDVCNASYDFVFYADANKRKVAAILKTDVVMIPPFSVFIDSSYVQHDGAKYLM